MVRTPTSAHPLIEAYVNDDRPLTHILAGMRDNRDPFIKAIAALTRAGRGMMPAREALALAESISGECADPHLYILFLCCWANISLRENRISEITGLLNRARALVSPRTPPALRAAIMNIEGALAASRGNYLVEEELLSKTLAFMPHSSLRRAMWAHQLALLLSQQGRLADTEKKSLHHRDPEYLTFVDAVERGSLKEVPFGFLDRSVILTARKLQLCYRMLLEWMCEVHPEWRAKMASPTATKAPDALQILRCLAARNPEEALLLARRESHRDFDPVTGLGFFSFNFIRAELGVGNADAARRLLDLRRNAGNQSYMDDFFYARIEILAGNLPAARRLFSRLTRATERYRAQGRLDCELRLAPDLSGHDYFHLVSPTPETDLHGKEPAKHIAVPAITLLESQGVHRCVGTSSTLRDIRQAIIQLAPSDIPVLITGETGTGKEVVAQAIHETSLRKEKPFLAINCAAIAESLLESELFGHVRGAFTGAEKAHPGLFREAGEGTLFLDEIGDIPPRIQVALLRVLESGEIRPVGGSQNCTFQCRILAATNADLEKQMEAGRFRKDLYFRLRRLEIHIPPLREHPGDICPLAEYFLGLGRSREYRPTLSLALQNTLLAHSWPGNVRELRNEIERMRLLNSDKLSYDVPDLDIRFRGRAAALSPLEPVLKERSHGARPAAGGAVKETSDPVLQRGRSSIRRLELLRQLFREHRTLTRAEIIQTLRISRDTATADLKKLCREKLIKKIEPNASPRTHYFELRLLAIPPGL